MSEPEVVAAPLVEETAVGESMAFIRCLEGQTGSKWEVRVLRFGESRNGWIWEPRIGPELVPHLDHAPIGYYAFRGQAGHLPDDAFRVAQGPLVRHIAGHLESPEVRADGVYATAHIHESASFLRSKLLELERHGAAVLQRGLGLSIDTESAWRAAEGVGKRVIQAIRRLASVDVVSNPSADGRFIRATAGPVLIPSTEEPMKEENGSTAVVDQARVLEAERAALTKEREALAALHEETKKFNAELALATSDRRVKEAVEATTLPEPIKAKMVGQLSGRVIEAEELAKRVAEEVDAYGKLAAGGDVKGRGETPATVTVAPRDKLQAALDRLFGITPETFARAMESSPFQPATIARIRESIDHNPAAGDPGLVFRGLRDAYVQVTGDRDVTGHLPRTARVSEASVLTTTWADLLGNTLYRKLLQTYAEPMYNERSIARFGSAPDFRDRHTVILGYFGDLSTVAEDAPYTAISVPTDDVVTYAVTKRGNLYTVTRETIINDDMRSVEESVRRLGRAARRTLAQFIWNFWINNSTYDGDSQAWFHANHGNTATTALTVNTTGAGAIVTALGQLAAALEPHSNKKLGLPDASRLWLMVPTELMGTAWAINAAREFGAGTNNQVFNWFGADNGRVFVNPLLTDATDWGIYVDVRAGDRSSIVVDFLGGREEPEFFLQDQPTVGEVFTHDRITWKIRHEYGGDVEDYRGAVKNVVA